jgi:hypothetical protein
MVVTRFEEKVALDLQVQLSEEYPIRRIIPLVTCR